MSKKVYTTNAGAFPSHLPIPVLEPSVKTGNGKATFKTASAAANAARDARDEAKALAKETADNLQQALKAKQACQLYAENMHRLYKRDLWWKIPLLLAMLADFLVLLAT